MLDNMLAFTRVIDKQGFAKAAKDLVIATSVLTRRINQLEKDLGVKLIQRSTRKLAITAAGQLFYDRCKEILTLTDASILAVQSINTNASGILKLGIPASLNQLFLLPAIADFIADYPDIRFEITEGNHLLALLEKNFDCVIHCGPLADSACHYRKLGQWTKVICAAPTYLASHPPLIEPDDLIHHNCLDHCDNVTGNWQFYRQHQVQSYKVSGTIKLNSSLALKKIAIAAQGLVCLPSFTVQDALQSGQLQVVLEDITLPPLDIFAVYPSKQFLSAKTRVFLAFMAKLFEPPTYEM